MPWSHPRNTGGAISSIYNHVIPSRSHCPLSGTDIKNHSSWSTSTSFWHAIDASLLYFGGTLPQVKFHPKGSPRAVPNTLLSSWEWTWTHEYKTTAHIISFPCTSVFCPEVVKFQAEASLGWLVRMAFSVARGSALLPSPSSPSPHLKRHHWLLRRCSERCLWTWLCHTHTSRGQSEKSHQAITKSHTVHSFGETRKPRR